MQWLELVLSLFPSASSLPAARPGSPQDPPARPVATRQVPAVAEDTKALAAALNRFGLRLFSAAAKPDGNLCASPTSVALALMMAQAGAAGATAEEMQHVLQEGLSDWPKDRLFAAARDLVEGVRASVPELELAVVNDLWPQAGHPLRADYVALVGTSFGADLRSLDFAADVERARQTINAHVAEHTKGRIPELIPMGLLDQATRLVLTNAVYLKAKWAMPFDSDRTSPRPFRLADGNTVQVPTMHQTGPMALFLADGAAILRLSYRDPRRRYVMEIVLPDEGRDPAAVLDLFADQPEFERKQVRLQLPKFTVRSALQLAGVLRQLGMKDALAIDRADFSGIDDGKGRLYISEVVHKTFLDVAEAGTEAAAATAVVMRAGAAAREEPLAFVVDRPFLCAIRDQTTGLLLFVTRVTDPR